MLRLDKEERLEMKRRMETSWSCKKTHYDHLIWARELLTGQVMDLVLMEGKEPDMTPEVQDEKISPEGWKGDEPEEVRRAHTTGGTYHHTSQEVKESLPGGSEPKKDQECQEKETIPAGRKTLKIPELFKSQERKIMEKDGLRLEKEERIERKRRIENSWKYKRTHYDHLRWARELLVGQVMDQVLLEGKDQGVTSETKDVNMGPEGWKRDEPEEVRLARATGGTFHQTSQEVKETIPDGRNSGGDQEPKTGEERVSPDGWKGGKMFLNRVKRLERARQQRSRLLRELEEVWSFI